MKHPQRELRPPTPDVEETPEICELGYERPRDWFQRRVVVRPEQVGNEQRCHAKQSLEEKA